MSASVIPDGEPAANPAMSAVSSKAEVNSGRAALVGN